MTWGKLDDRLDDNEKFASLSLSAAGLWLMCMPRALRNDDGFVPEAHALRFLSPTGRHSGRVLFRELVGAGLWEEVEGGWLIHDFTKYAAPNTNSAERVRRYRERKRAEKAQQAGQGNALQPLLKRDVTPLARAHTRRVIPDPEPVPVSLFASLTEPEGRGVTKSGAKEIFEAWVSSLPAGTSRTLTPERLKKIQARLKTYPVGEVLDAVKGWQNDPWPGRVNQNDITQILRSDEQCEKFRDLWRHGPPQSNAPSSNPVSREIQSFTAFADAEARGERL